MDTVKFYAYSEAEKDDALYELWHDTKFIGKATWNIALQMALHDHLTMLCADTGEVIISMYDDHIQMSHDLFAIISHN